MMALVVAVTSLNIVLAVAEGSSCVNLLDRLELPDFDENRSKTDTVRFTETGVRICTQGRCRELSNEKLQAAFPYAFSTIVDYINRTGQPYHSKLNTIPRYCYLPSGLKRSSCSKRTLASTSYCKTLPPGDGDSCCSTHIYATFYTEKMQNTNSQTCVIIRLRTSFQMVTEGICGPCGSCHSDPQKSCLQQYTTQPLLAWNTVTHTVGFEMFHIPAYCSCINGN